MVSKNFRPWVVVALAAVAIYVAQLIPLIGIFLMLLAAAFVPGLLFHLSMILLVLDVRQQKTPRAFLALPITFYAFGLAAFALSHVHAYTLSLHMASMDESAQIAYNPETQIIVFNDNRARNSSALHRELQANYALDLAFVADASVGQEAFVASHVLARERCEALESRAAQIRVSYFRVRDVQARNACILQVSQPLDERALIVVSMQESEQRWGFETVELTRTEIRAGETRALINTAAMRVYPPIPILIAGCGLNSGQASWDCLVDFMRFRHEIGGRGEELGGRLEAVAAVLGLSERRVAATERSNPWRDAGNVEFAPDPRQEEMLRVASGLAERRLAAFFSDLPRVIQNPGLLQSNQWSLAAAEPAHLGVYARPILDAVDAVRGEAYNQNLFDMLTRMMAALPADIWQAEEARILRLMEDSTVYARRPDLLARVGDYGVAATPILMPMVNDRDRRNGPLRMAALLGVCRAGAEVDSPQMRVAVQAAWHEAPIISQAVFLALLRMGAHEEAAAIVLDDDRRVQAWRAEQLAQVTPASPRSVCHTLADNYEIRSFPGD